MSELVWVAVFLCLVQSAMFSGLNLAVFLMSKLELEVEAKKGNLKAVKVLKLRNDANFTLVTILWGNVSVNVLLALLADSVLAGVSAFVFSTFVITIFAEILPQAYFSRHALRVAALLAPMLRVYQVLLFPVAKPTAMILDAWLGGEALRVFSERDMRQVIKLHMESAESDIARMEGRGALNFLDIDDVHFTDEGELIAPGSIIQLEFDNDKPRFPKVSPTPDDPFLRQLHQGGRKWTVLVDAGGEPRLVLKTRNYLSDVFMSGDRAVQPIDYCHRPIVVRDGNQTLGTHLPSLRVTSGKTGTEVIDKDTILLWNEHPRIITGTDLLGRLFRGIGDQRDAHHIAPELIHS